MNGLAAEIVLARILLRPQYERLVTAARRGNQPAGRGQSRRCRDDVAPAIPLPRDPRDPRDQLPCCQ